VNGSEEVKPSKSMDLVEMMENENSIATRKASLM